MISIFLLIGFILNMFYPKKKSAVNDGNRGIGPYYLQVPYIRDMKFKCLITLALLR